MGYEIIWSKEAGDELAEIISFAKYNNGKIPAKKLCTRLIYGVKQVSENPEGRRIAPLLREFGIYHIHQLNISPWILFYRLGDRKMEIISIMDGRRNPEEILYRKIMDGKIA